MSHTKPSWPAISDRTRREEGSLRIELNHTRERIAVSEREPLAHELGPRPLLDVYAHEATPRPTRLSSVSVRGLERGYAVVDDETGSHLKVYESTRMALGHATSADGRFALLAHDQGETHLVDLTRGKLITSRRFSLRLRMGKLERSVYMGRSMIGTLIGLVANVTYSSTHGGGSSIAGAAIGFGASLAAVVVESYVVGSVRPKSDSANLAFSPDGRFAVAVYPGVGLQLATLHNRKITAFEGNIKTWDFSATGAHLDVLTERGALRFDARGRRTKLKDGEALRLQDLAPTVREPIEARRVPEPLPIFVHTNLQRAQIHAQFHRTFVATAPSPEAPSAINQALVAMIRHDLIRIARGVRGDSVQARESFALAALEHFAGRTARYREVLALRPDFFSAEIHAVHDAVQGLVE